MSPVAARHCCGVRRPRTGEAVTALLVLLGLTYALASAPTYGQSWDDPGDAAFGGASLRAYAGERGYLDSGDRKFYGPAYLMAAAGVSSALDDLWLSWQAVDIRHFLNFVCFVLATLALYGIARRMMSPAPAGIAALAFFFQPVLFGHAFINQKDIPLLAGFTGAIFLGLRIGDPMKTDSRVGADAGRSSPGFLRSFLLGWRSASGVRRGLFILAGLIALALVADLIFGGALLASGKRIIAAAYAGEAIAPLNTLFSLVARDADKTPSEAYASKFEAMFGWIRLVGVYAALTPMIIMTAAMSRPGVLLDPGEAISIRRVALAAIVLGLTISVRVVGLFAGGLVTLAVLGKRGRPGLTTMLLYGFIALSVTYLTWPYLWEAPVSRIVESVRVMADFPSHPVLFAGSMMSSTRLPWVYLPTVLAIQLTEPVLILLAVGLAAVPRFWRRSRDDRVLLLLVMLWFLVPFAASVIWRVPLYSNFRQLLFALPPIFLVAALGIDLVWSRLRAPWLKAVLVVVLLLPGLAAIVRLRPYEYVYYNALAGGVKGAEGRFAHDYWCTSYREAMAFVNRHAPAGARVAVSEPFGAAATFARPDLRVARRTDDPQAAYVLRCNNRGDLTLRNLEGFPVAFAVVRSGVVLSVVLGPETAPADGSRESGPALFVGRLADWGGGT